MAELPRRQLTVGLGLVLAALAWIVAAQLFAANELDISAGQSASEESKDFAAVLATAPAFPPLSEFSEIIKRPVFAEARRITEPEPVAADEKTPSEGSPATIPKVTVTPLQATLKGIVRSPQGDIAILSVPGESEPVRLQQGEVFKGWSLEDIGTHVVTLSGGGQVVRLHLAFRGEDEQF